MATPTNCPDPARLRDLLDGSLPEAQQAELTAHLETCESCQQAVEGLVAGRDSWVGAARQLGAGSAPLDPVLKSAMEHAREAQPHVATEAEADPHVELPRDFLSPADEPGHLGKLAHYEVFDVVGRGAMGIVLRAFDQKLHRVVAIKVMSPQLASSASARKRFVREGQAAAAVCHEHVVTIHAVEEAHGLPYLVMQYVGGVSLQDRLDASGPLELREILRIGMQAAEGLAAAHAQGLVHRDIKPSNILLENGVERVKITDFGLARAVDDASLTQTGVIAGTPQYMAPEQAHGAALDHRADLFSLGSVLYALCAGRAPFRSSTMMAVLKRVCEETPRPIREINPDIPDWLAAIITKLHEKNPVDRFQSAKEVGDLLGQHLAHLQRPDGVALPQPVTVAQPVAAYPASPEPARQALGGTEPKNILPQYLTRMIVAGFMLVFAAVSAGSGLRGLQFMIPVQLIAAVLLLIAMIHAVAVRLYTGAWHGTLVGLFVTAATPAVADSQSGSTLLRPPLTLLLIVCLLGAAASFAVPWWVHEFWIHPLAIGRTAGLGWLLLGLAFYFSASGLRKTRAAKMHALDVPAVDASGRNPATIGSNRRFTLQRTTMMAVIAVCVMIVLVPIGLAAAIGISWMAYSRRAVPQAVQVSVPVTSRPTGSDRSAPSIHDWHGTEVERALLGRWYVVSQEVEGRFVPEEDRLEWLQFGSHDDNSRVIESARSGQLSIVKYYINEAPEEQTADRLVDNHRSLSLVITTDVPIVGTELRHGIFRIEEDVLTLCLVPAGDPCPANFETERIKSAVLYVLNRYKPSETATTTYPRDSIVGEWSSASDKNTDWGDVTFEHEPIQNYAPVKVTGWLHWNKSQTRTRFEGTFDPARELVEITFEKELIPNLERTARLKLSVDGRKLVGLYHMSFSNTNDADIKYAWELTRKHKTAEPPAATGAPKEE